MSNPAPVLWFTGLSGAGKTTIGSEIRSQLQSQGTKVELLDGDEIRAALSSDLGFSREDRDLQVRRLGWIANLLSRNGIIVLVSAISPFKETRNQVLSSLPWPIEIFVDAPLETLEKRDTKGLYEKVRLGLIRGLTGVDDPYEPPEFPDLHLHTAEQSLESSVEEVFTLLVKEGVIASS